MGDGYELVELSYCVVIDAAAEPNRIGVLIWRSDLAFMCIA